MEFSGYYYNGKNSGREDVSAEFINGRIIVRSDRGVLCDYNADSVLMKSGVGSAPSHIIFPDGSSVETKDNAAVNHIQASLKKNSLWLFVGRLESRRRYIFLSFVSVVLIFLGAFFYGVPALSKAVAFSLPVETNRVIANGTLKMLDEHLFSPSRLTVERKAGLTESFDRMLRGLPEGFEYKLVFRSGGKLGANAMALPDGTVVVTDELVNLSGRDEEITAVLAHELGHVAMRHGVRTLLQGSVISAAVIAVTGDVSSLTVGIPALLVKSKYSREFEREADRFAIKLLTEHNISVIYFADILTKLSEQHKESGSRVTDYISSHPATKERVKMIREAAEGI
ncbi:MAG: M48 family metallopeptidase [Deferribacterales bacterium]